MLKQVKALKAADLEQEYREYFRGLLLSLPVFKKVATVVPPKSERVAGYCPDLMFRVDAGKETWYLICEVKAYSQPRHVRIAVLQLKEYLSRPLGRKSYGVLLAPYVSPESAEICAQANIGYADQVGNCRLSFGSVYVERMSQERPTSARREQRSIFSPKSARVLRLLLSEPHRSWKGVELVLRADVSLGQVSNVRKALLDREWAKEDEGGIRLSNPVTVLFEWRKAMPDLRVEHRSLHTLLHGTALESAIRGALVAAGRGEHAVLASFSAANWIAPFTRSSTTWFHADAKGEAVLTKHLRLEPAGKGGNVSIVCARDKGVFLDRIEPAPGIWTTGLAQTYLDLYPSGERGAEAGEHLLQQKIAPQWQESK